MRKIFAFVLALTFGAGTTFAIDGALSGKFTINLSGSQVQFSQGNLQYKAAPTPTWQFATNQWDTIGIANKNIADDYEGWIDLFGWGTGANPTMHSEVQSDYATFTDWGVNAISNGGNVANAWRTLSRDEWYHIFAYRTDAAMKFGQATVVGHYGLVILPDEWVMPDGLTFTPQPNNWTTNVYDAAAWDKMATNGAVFLPYSQIRQGVKVDFLYPGSTNYWSATRYNNYHSWEIGFREEKIITWDVKYSFYGCCVRLVNDPVPAAVGDTIIARSGANKLIYTITALSPNKAKLLDKGHTLADHKLTIPSSVEHQGQNYAVDEIAGGALFPGIDTITLPASLTKLINFWNFRAVNLKAFLVEDGSTLYTSVDGVLYSKNKKTLYRCPELKEFDGTFTSEITTIGDRAFMYCKGVTDVTIPSSITYLSNCLFASSTLQKVTIPASVTSLTNGVFSTCTQLAEVIFADVSNLTVAWDAFNGSKILTDQGDGLQRIGALAVKWKGAYPDTLVIPEGIVNIGYAFYGGSTGFSTLKKIELPSTLKIMDAGAFADGVSQKMANLSSIVCKAKTAPKSTNFLKFPHDGTLTLTIPCDSKASYESSLWCLGHDIDAIEESLVYNIKATAEPGGSVAISDTTDCNRVTLTATPDPGYVFDKWSNGATTEQITISVFSDREFVASFRKVPAVGDTLRYEYKGNNLYYKVMWKNSARREVGLVNDGTPATYWTEANEPEGALIIPDSIEDWQGTKYAVTDIYEYAFGGCEKITSVDLSENKDIKAVGRYSFGECTALASVTLSDNIISIYSYAFYKAALTSFDFKNVEELGSWAFLSGNNIETVNINKAMKQIPDQTGLFDHAKVITCDAENAKFTAVDNVLYNKDMTKLISLPLGLTAEIHIPTTVTTALYQAMKNYAGPIYINSEIKFDWGPDERNSPKGDVVVGCGLYEYYTTGDFDKTNPKSNFYYVANLTAELLYEVTLKQTAGGTIAKADGTECAEVVLTATPDAGFVFTKWSDESTENPHTITVTADVEVSAVFTKQTGIDAILGAPARDGKFIRDGQLFIRHNGKIYDANGAKVK